MPVSLSMAKIINDFPISTELLSTARLMFKWSLYAPVAKLKKEETNASRVLPKKQKHMIIYFEQFHPFSDIQHNRHWPNDSVA